MKKWHERPHEERNLLNPAFCATILWYAGKGAIERAAAPRHALAFTEAFLILPFVLHEKTRESLPNRVNTSLPVWIDSQSLLVANLPRRAKTLVPHTKEAITFGGCSQLFSIENHELFINPQYAKSIALTLKESSDEVRQCMRKAEFLGKWFAHTGAPETIFTLFGIRP